MQLKVLMTKRLSEIYINNMVSLAKKCLTIEPTKKDVSSFGHNPNRPQNGARQNLTKPDIKNLLKLVMKTCKNLIYI